MNPKVREISKKLIFYIVASIIGFIIVIPFLWMISTSLKSKGAIMAIPVQWVPEEVSFEGYKNVFKIIPFSRAIFNSFFVTILSTCITLISSSMAAFVFSKVYFKGRDVVFSIYIATMMIPAQVTTIPLFLVLTKMGLVNTFTGLIMPTVFNAFAIFMLKQQMITIPDDYMDAAIIDGANMIAIFNKIILPMSKSVLATLTVIAAMGYWNDYYWPLIILSGKSKITLPLALSLLNGQYSSQYNTLMAGSLLSMLPIIILYYCSQNYFQAGLQLGGIKG